MRLLLFLLMFPSVFVGQNAVEQSYKLMASGQFKKVENLLKPYVEESPNDEEGLELLGDAYSNQKEWDHAIEVYRRLVDLQPKNAEYHYKYGGAMGMKALSVNKFRALTMIDDVEEAFLKGAELDPKHIDVRWALVEYYMQLPGIIGGSMDSALKYANELEELSVVDGYLAKGYIYQCDDDNKNAEYYYRRALTVGRSVTCYTKLSKLYVSWGRPEKAIANYELGNKHNPLNEFQFLIGEICAEHNIQLDKGEDALQQFISNYSGKDTVSIEQAYYRLAQIYRLKRDKSEALVWINKALAANSNFNQALQEKQRIQNL